MSFIDSCAVFGFMDPTGELLPTTKSQLAGDLVHLRKLWTSLRRTGMVVERAMIAYGDSRRLLERIDGAPSVHLRSDIRIAE